MATSPNVKVLFSPFGTLYGQGIRPSQPHFYLEHTMSMTQFPTSVRAWESNTQDVFVQENVKLS